MIQNNISNPVGNICKLFVKEKSPPSLRTEKRNAIISSDNTTYYSCINQETQHAAEPQLIACEVFIEGNCQLNNPEKSPEELETISASLPSLSYLNSECHETQYNVENHELDVLCGLNRLRNEGNLLDVTLWAENQPFQVRKINVILK